jgi:acyl-CoA thioesterase-2
VTAPPRDLATLFALEPHGPDTFVGVSPPYEWGRIYGGQVIAQGLCAAARTVPEDRSVHSLHAYFILGGRLDEPVRYEVDRVRNGSSFMTRRVVARQSYGAILTLEASFQVDEAGSDVQTVQMPINVLPPDAVPDLGWGWMMDRRQVSVDERTGRVLTWVRVDGSVGASAVERAAALAFASDTSTVAAVRAVHPRGAVSRMEMRDVFMGASLDHALWFHRPVRTDSWLLIDMQCHALVGVRGLSIGNVFDEGGTHVATIAQEALLRERRPAGGQSGDLSGT